ncbi:hypothetical protein C0V76_19335 [Uliginosibacterium sp. TH139]|nr:hypothetical protein C0V76_19335 [Uliginosibacterium sp. TH139]
MAEFQQQWDTDPKIAFLDAAYEGVKEGGGDWGKSIGDLFDKKTWKEVGQKIQHFAGKAIDTMADYSAQQYEELRESLNGGANLIEHADDTIKNWAWWQTVIDRKAEQARDYTQKKVDTITKTVNDTTATVLDSVDKSNKIYQHRNAILNLPNLITEGDAKGVQNFVDTVLKDIDPTLAKSIKESGQFHIALELIADHDSALNYVSYLGLMLEAVPPNFYAYTSAKFGVQLLLEVILTVLCAFLTAGTGVAVRLTTLAARLTAASVKVTTVARRIQKAQAALRAYARMLEDFLDASRQMHRLGEKLLAARRRGVTVRGKTRQTLSAKKKLIKRDTRCRLCGSTEHSTPRGRLGNVEYD